MHEINKINWVLRDIKWNLDQVEDRLVDLYCVEDKIDTFNISNDDPLIRKLGIVNDALVDLQDFIIQTYGASDEN